MNAQHFFQLPFRVQNVAAGAGLAAPLGIATRALDGFEIGDTALSARSADFARIVVRLLGLGQFGNAARHLGEVEQPKADGFEWQLGHGHGRQETAPSVGSRVPLGRVLDKRLAHRAVERRDQGEMLGLVGQVVGRVDLFAQGRGLGAVVDGFLDRLLHPPLLTSAHADTAGGSQQSNIATGRGGASRGAERDILSVSHAPPGRPAGWRERGFEWARSRRHSSTSRLFTVGFDVRGRDVSQVGAADGGVKLRRVRQLGALRPQAGGFHRLGDGRADQIQFHTRIPSVAARNMRAATSGRTLPTGAFAQ